MPAVDFDPKTLSFIVHVPTGVSGCEQEVYTVDLDNHTLVHEYCRDGEPVKEEIPLDSDEARETLTSLAKDTEYDGVEPALLAVIAGAPIDEFFLDVRYVVDIDSRGRPRLIAVELLPCMGDPSCDWIRVEPDNKVRRAFLDYMEELVVNNLLRA